MKQAAHADRPHHRADVQCQGALDFIEQFKGTQALAVDFVDECEDRNIAQAADFEQFPCLVLDALGGVDHHHRRIDRRQRTVGIFAEILMARRVEKIEGDVCMLEGHHRTRDRDAALALDRHPVRARAPALAAPLDVAGQMYGAAGMQQALGQRRLAGIRMGDNGEGLAWRHGNSFFSRAPPERSGFSGATGRIENAMALT